MFVRTNRLFLRPGWAEDAPALAEAINDLAIARMLERVPHPYGVEDARAFLAAAQAGDLPTLLVFRRTAGQPRLVGGVGLHRAGSGDADAVRLGYWIARSHWGLGYATEAARGVLALGFDSLRLTEVTACHHLDNPASARVLDKLGFVATGIGQSFSLARGAAAPVRDYRLTRDARQAPRGRREPALIAA